MPGRDGPPKTRSTCGAVHGATAPAGAVISTAHSRASRALAVAIERRGRRTWVMGGSTACGLGPDTGRPSCHGTGSSTNPPMVGNLADRPPAARSSSGPVAAGVAPAADSPPQGYRGRLDGDRCLHLRGGSPDPVTGEPV